MAPSPPERPAPPLVSAAGREGTSGSASDQGKRAAPERRRRRRLALVGFVLAVAAAVVVVDHWLPYMLVSYHKFAVDPDPPAFGDFGATHETVRLRTSDGLALAAWFVPPPEGRAGACWTIVVVHTLGRTRQDMLGLALPLWRKGFALLLLDLRGHGESEGDYFTFGYHEWRDVAAAIDHLAERGDGSGERVAVLGASAGGAVAIAAAARDGRIRALVSIAAFADLDRMAARRARWLPGFWVERALRKAERIGKFSVREASPVRNIARVECPTLIVHGDADQLVPFADGQTLYHVARGPKEFYPIAGADHASMFARGGDELVGRIATFIRSSDRGARPGKGTEHGHPPPGVPAPAVRP